MPLFQQLCEAELLTETLIRLDVSRVLVLQAYKDECAIREGYERAARVHHHRIALSIWRLAREMRPSYYREHPGYGRAREHIYGDDPGPWEENAVRILEDG
jgi:hypothetical protein